MNLRTMVIDDKNENVERACPFCASQETCSEPLEARDPLAPDHVYRAILCVKCGGAWTEANAASYGESFFKIGRFKRLIPGISRARRRAWGGDPGEKILDVGAGEGDFVRLARAAGHDARGMDPHAPTADYRGVDEIRRDGFRPDLVTLWQSLEHVDDPLVMLTELHALLADGGRIFISVPNFASAQARWGKADWFHLDLPRHRFHFTAASIEALAARAGFSTRFRSGIAWEYDPAGWLQTLANRVFGRPNALYNLLKGSASGSMSVDWICALLTILLLPALLPLSVALSLLFHGPGRGGGAVIEVDLFPLEKAAS
jgi:SAM-dependent methyltransferase